MQKGAEDNRAFAIPDVLPVLQPGVAPCPIVRSSLALSLALPLSASYLKLLLTTPLIFSDTLSPSSSPHPSPMNHPWCSWQVSIGSVPGLNHSRCVTGHLSPASSPVCASISSATIPGGGAHALSLARSRQPFA